MKRFNRIAAVALLVATSVVMGAAAQASTPSAWDKFKAYTHQQKTEAVAEGKKLLAATDKQIAELSKQARNSAGEVKVEHEKNMLELQARKKEAQAQLDRMGAATSNAWEATKEGFSNAGKELHTAYEKATASAKK